VDGVDGVVVEVNISLEEPPRPGEGWRQNVPPLSDPSVEEETPV